MQQRGILHDYFLVVDFKNVGSWVELYRTRWEWDRTSFLSAPYSPLCLSHKFVIGYKKNKNKTIFRHYTKPLATNTKHSI